MIKSTRSKLSGRRWGLDEVIATREWHLLHRQEDGPVWHGAKRVPAVSTGRPAAIRRPRTRALVSDRIAMTTSTHCANERSTTCH